MNNKFIQSDKQERIPRDYAIDCLCIVAAYFVFVLVEREEKK